MSIETAAEIVSAYVLNHKIEASALPNLIQSVYSSLSQLGEPEAPVKDPIARPTSAQIKKSITPDALISFVDGKRYKTLKRHLATHDLTIDQYKAKFGLPQAYPSTAPSYSERRSAMAKTMGLGARGRGGAGLKAAPAAPTSPVQAKAAPKTRKPKAVPAASD